MWFSGGCVFCVFFLFFFKVERLQSTFLDTLRYFNLALPKMIYLGGPLGSFFPRVLEQIWASKSLSKPLQKLPQWKIVESYCFLLVFLL